MHADAPAESAAFRCPASPAIGRFEETVSGSGVKNTWVTAIDHQRIKTHTQKRIRCQDIPGRATVSRSINTRAQVSVEVAFAASRVDQTRSGRMKSECADRERWH